METGTFLRGIAMLGLVTTLSCQRGTEQASVQASPPRREFNGPGYKLTEVSRHVIEIYVDDLVTGREKLYRGIRKIDDELLCTIKDTNTLYHSSYTTLVTTTEEDCFDRLYPQQKNSGK